MGRIRSRADRTLCKCPAFPETVPSPVGPGCHGRSCGLAMSGRPHLGSTWRPVMVTESLRTQPQQSAAAQQVSLAHGAGDLTRSRQPFWSPSARHST